MRGASLHFGCMLDLTAGLCFFLQAGLLKHGKDLAVVRRTHWRERTVGQVARDGRDTADIRPRSSREKRPGEETELQHSTQLDLFSISARSRIGGRPVLPRAVRVHRLRRRRRRGRRSAAEGSNAEGQVKYM